jgi:hypothetical protein
VGDCTSFHNQFLNRPHPANEFKIFPNSQLSKADEAIVVGCVVPVALADRARISTSMRSPAISAQTSDMSGNSWSRPVKRNARAVDASVTWNYTTWFNIASLILAILFYKNKFNWDYKANPHLTPVI